MVVVTMIITACNNPFFPDKEEKGRARINAGVPVISVDNSNLSDVECFEGDEPILTVGVVGDEDDFSYQWYSNTEDSNENGTLIDGAVDPDFMPPTDEEGTTYYYVVITNKRNGKTTASRPVKVTVYPPSDVPVISVNNSNLSDVECFEGDEPILTVGVVGDEDDFSYQWYSNTEDSNENGTLIDGAVDPDFMSPTDEPGTTWYYVVITNKRTGKTTTSRPVKVTVIPEYTIVIDIIDAGTGDTVTASPDTGKAGDTVTLAYTVVRTAHYNLLDFGGVTTSIDSVNSTGSGTRTYTINAADASNGVITITAIFTHTDLEPDPIAFDDTEGHITKTYGDAAFTNAVAEGYKGGGAITYSSSDTTVADVDGSGQVTILKAGSAIITAEKAADAVYAHAQTDYTLTVNHKQVIITGLSASNKVYDGTTTVTISGTAALSGVVSGDTVTLGGTRIAAFADKNAGTAKAVIISGYTISGTDAGNYSLTQPSVTANITTKSVTITGLSAANKQYDGTTTATVSGTATISGKISTDTVTVSAGTAVFANATVGNNKTVTFSGYSLTGADAGNYSLSTQPASVTANISLVDMVQISAGTFTMGSPTTEADRSSSETQHSVTLSAFYMSTYQVTQALYQLVMGTNPSNFTTAVAGESGTPGRLPVEMVTWYDAVEFCNKLSALDGKTAVYTITGRTPASGYPITSATVTMDSSKNGYRLPTEAQWEYACRAGTTTAYNTGNTISDNTGWYNNNSGNKTHEVGLKPANAWGLYDMHGNVEEWCWDWFGTYASGAQTNPIGASTGAHRVKRGGSWLDNGQVLRSAYRYNSDPSIRNRDLGFRLVRQ